MTTVLVIDDDPAMLDVIRLGLEAYRFHVLEASNAADAVSLFRGRRPVLVITDIQLADSSGLDVVRELHAIDPAVPIIAMSGELASDEASALRKAVQLGATGIIEKPFRRQELIDAVIGALSAGQS
jgi:DNA-binding response OmpR family regulator